MHAAALQRATPGGVCAFYHQSAALLTATLATFASTAIQKTLVCGKVLVLDTMLRCALPMLLDRPISQASV